MMPAMSPFMTEGTITRWKKKEGESFAAGEILLQIVRLPLMLCDPRSWRQQESDVAMIDVQAENPGIIGRILVSILGAKRCAPLLILPVQKPDGSTKVPVEQVIALVARDAEELAKLQSRSPEISSHPRPPFLSPMPSPISPSFLPYPSPRMDTPRSPAHHHPRTTSHLEQSGSHASLLHASVHRSHMVPELHPSMMEAIHAPSPAASIRGMSIDHGNAGNSPPPVSYETDGFALRRKIVSTLSQDSATKGGDGPRLSKKCTTTEYFDGII